MRFRDIDPDLLALKTKTDALIRAAGGCTSAADVLGCTPSIVSMYGSPHHMDRFMPIDDIMVLERHVQNAVIGKTLVEMREGDPKPVPVLSIETVARLAKEGGEAKMAIVNGLADGKIDAADRKDIAKQLREALAEYEAALRAVEAA